MIGYYVHHVGRGHLRHLQAIAPHLDEPVTALSSLPRPDDWTGPWLPLPRDDDADAVSDPTAHGTLHWVPLGDTGLRGRMAELARWIAAEQPRVMVCDVSVEIAVFARLMGVAVVVMALPGDRDDPAHRSAYRLAARIIAPWPADHGLDRSLQPWLERTVHVGGLSRYAGRPVPAPAPSGTPTVLVVDGLGGERVRDDQVADAALGTPGWRWQHIGPGRWCEDPWALLCAADVVVTHAGLGAIADVAAAGRPTVVIAQDRPHCEQRRTAQALAAHDLVVSLDAWPERADWPAALAAAQRCGGDRWRQWNTGGAARAAAAIAAVARAGPILAAT